MIDVEVTTGIGAWTATKMVKLVACPHVGDCILVGERVITCDHVYIGPDYVSVNEKRPFQSEQDAKDFFK